MPVENLKIRRAEPEDYLALYEMFHSPDLFAGTLQLPFPSRELWRKRLAEAPEGYFNLVAVVDDRVVGMLSVETFPKQTTPPARRKNWNKCAQ